MNSKIVISLYRRYRDLSLRFSRNRGLSPRVPKDPHAPGLAGPRTSALPGAAAGAFSGGLIPEGKNGSAAALTIPHGLCSCGGGAACIEVRQFGSIQGRIVIESGVSLPETA